MESRNKLITTSHTFQTSQTPTKNAKRNELLPRVGSNLGSMLDIAGMKAYWRELTTNLLIASNSQTR